MQAIQRIGAISSALVALFPDEKITRDLNEQLFSGLPAGENLSVDLDGLETFEILPHSQHTVCSVVLQHDLIPASEEARVICAVGGVERVANGIVEPKYCFAVLRYNQDGVLYAYDLYASQFN